jgi:hypothetical protein
VHPQNENLHVGEMIFIRPARASCAETRNNCTPLPQNQTPCSSTDAGVGPRARKQPALAIPRYCAPKLKGPMSCSPPDCLLVPAQNPIASAIARLNLHVRHLGRIRWQAYSGAETRVSRRVTLPEGFEKPKLRSACSLDAVACCGLQPFLHNALIQ